MKNIAEKQEAKKAIREEILNDDELLDLNELITGGKDGFIAFPISGDFPETGINKGDLVFVDQNARINKDSLTLHIKNGKSIVQKASFGLRLVTKNGQKVETSIPFNSAEVVGVVTHVLRGLYAEVSQ